MFDKGFISKRSKAEGTLFSLREANNESRKLVGYALEDKILERTPLKDVETSMLFTYMHRRFGLGNLGGDDYKDLGAGWLITTPHENLALIVSPSFSGRGFSFRPVIVVESPDRNAVSNIGGDSLQSMADAYERTLLDLLRPVIQRDMDFNVLGEISDKNPAPEWAVVEEDEDGDYDQDAYDLLPQYHETCGLPMPDGVFGAKAWQQTLTLFSQMGEGDIGKGMEAFVLHAEEQALEVARKARPDILPIIAGGIRLASMDNDMDNDDADRKIAALGVSDDPRVREYIAGSYGNGRTETPSDWFMKVTEAEIREAAELVAAFGLGTYQMEKGIETIARTQRHIVEWARFREISGGEFDEKLIPEVHYITGEAVEEWRRNVAASRDVRLSEWAEAVAGDAIGNQVLGQILSLLHFKKVEVEREAAKSQETPRES
jgi:hypothetical protein